MKFSIKNKLFVVLGSLSLILAFTNWVSFSGASSAKASLNTIFVDRVQPMQDLKNISDNYAVHIVDASNKIRNGSMSAQEGIQSINSAMAESNKLWAAYLATYLDDTEVKLVADVKPKMANADEKIDRLKAILQANNKDALEAFIRTDLYPAIDPVTETLDKLHDHQGEVVESEYKKTTSMFERNGDISLALLLFAVLGVAFGGYTVVAGVVRPMQGLTNAMTTLAKSDWSTEVPALGRHDEIGVMAKSVEVFKTNGMEAERLRNEQAQEQKKQLDRAENINRIVAGFEKEIAAIVNGVSSAATELQSTAESMTSTAEETSSQANTVAAASEQATANVQTVASATEELSASIREILQRVGSSNDQVSLANDQASTTNAKVKELSEASTKIGMVIQLINDIAAQTNLLALNATIEAARAGEAGKGFAVVASEVKTLAKETAKATEEIAQQVKGIQEASNSSVDAIGLITRSIEDIKKTSVAISAAVEEQGAATQEISRNVTQAATGTKEVSVNILQVSEAAQRTGAAATQVLSAAGELSKNGANLKTQVDMFLRAVRAA